MDSTSKMRRSKNKFKNNTDGSSRLDERSMEEIFSENPRDNSGSASSEINVETPTKAMPTFPETFKSLVDTPIYLTNENREPQCIIELLGTALGVGDYKTNMASFWFLDFLALQILHYEPILDSHDKSVLVSWLAGEMKLIREKNLSREAFFQEMEDIFIDRSEKLERGLAVPHWDLLLLEKPKEDILVHTNLEKIPNKMKESTLKMTKHRVSSRDQKRRSMKNDGKFSDNSLNGKKDETKNNIIDIDKDFNEANTDSNKVLDAIIEATYSMYGNSFHYALIVAAFVKPVSLHEYIFPFVLRQPRPLKILEHEKHDKNKTTQKNHDSSVPRKGKETNENAKITKKAKKKSNDVETIENVAKASTTVFPTDEEILAKKREFILPLMDAKEASNILETYREINTQKKNVLRRKTKS